MFGPWDTGEKAKDAKAKGTSLAQGLQHGHSPHQQTKQKIKSAKVKVPQDQVKGPAISHNQTVRSISSPKKIYILPHCNTTCYIFYFGSKELPT